MGSSSLEGHRPTGKGTASLSQVHHQWLLITEPWQHHKHASNLSYAVHLTFGLSQGIAVHKNHTPIKHI